MKERVLQLDFLKGVFILLMVAFHNYVIGDGSEHISRLIYTVHMPAFLIISGYLANVDKDVPEFGKSMLRLIVPYTIFETMYIVMIFLLGKVMNTSNQIEELSPLVIIDKLFLNPIGTYWYIHTMIICTTVYYVVRHVLKLKDISALAVMGSALFLLSLVIGGGLKMSNVIFYLIGTAIVMSGKSFMTVIKPSVLVVVPIILLVLFSDDYSRGTLSGAMITVLSISLLLFVFDHSAQTVKNFFAYLGRNSLAVVLFSPAFTVMSNKLIKYISFGPFQLLFTLVSIAITIAGCMLITWISDKLGLSRLLFCKERAYSKYGC